MGEKKGFIYGLFIMGAFFIPALLDLWIANVKSDQFMKVTTEFHQLVQEEGGKTARVQQVIGGLEDMGYNIYIPVDGQQPVGTEIEITYNYEYPGAFGIEHKYNTSNKVVVTRR